MKFDIVKIGCYNMIFGILQLYEYNSQIDWIIGLISTIWYRKNRSIPIERDLVIKDIYKERDINKSIQIIKILNSTDTSFFINIVSKEY